MIKHIAAIGGGYSSENEISLKSVQTIMHNLDQALFKGYLIIIEKDKWYYAVNGARHIVDKNNFSVPDLGLTFDFAFIMVHGTPGEDGKLQAYFDMIGLPYSTSDHLMTTLTFNKWACNSFLSRFNIPVAKSCLIRQNSDYNADNIIKDLGLPLFVKPNEAGSSFGVSKVNEPGQLETAIEKARTEDGNVIIEAFLKGREITVGAYKNSEGIIVLPITEIISSNDFFDYKAKYLGESSEITPANLDENTAGKARKYVRDIYALMNLKGFVRMDFIVVDGAPHLIEINTVPGFSPMSIVPQQIKAAEKEVSEAITDVINYALEAK